MRRRVHLVRKPDWRYTQLSRDEVSFYSRTNGDVRWRKLQVREAKRTPKAGVE